uniref:PA2c domain-containing protein n=1 Tax=Ascaris lumbricoides TaxID=6252 RepID=A0A0M3IJG6_ASCLU
MSCDACINVFPPVRQIQLVIASTVNWDGCDGFLLDLGSTFYSPREWGFEGFDLKSCGSLWETSVILLFTFYMLLRVLACEAHGEVISVRYTHFFILPLVYLFLHNSVSSLSVCVSAFASLTWICAILVVLPFSNAVVCHSNVRDTKQEEDCGPSGYCFFQDISSADNVYRRGCDHLFLCEWICAILVVLPFSNAVVCHSNVRDTKQEEDCGPSGYCFFQDISSADNVYRRGCDHLFLCELLINSNVSQPSSYFNKTSKTLKAYFQWCAPDVPYTGIDSSRHDGTFCCCNTDFCNKDEPDEPEQPFHKAYFQWCAPDVPYTGIDSSRHDGTFCCCNTDFCNKDEPDEPEQPFHKVQQLISGTKADYMALLQVARDLGIIKESPNINSFRNCTSHANGPCYSDDF